MAVKIRLSRVGKKNAPYYRIVALDSRKKRDGASLEILGTYNPLNGELIQFNAERIDAWIKVGAIPSLAVKRLSKLHKKATMPAVPAQ
jgi:small subunit ribosomal protein S16